ncbi:MAG: family 43 glycosylhydrolase [Butyrivibrio sp.]|nr:family 43 glycosylhydrolase [Butyrivibrio sp.]
MMRRRGKWLAIALSAAMTVTSLPAANMQVKAESAKDGDLYMADDENSEVSRETSENDGTDSPVNEKSNKDASDTGRDEGESNEGATEDEAESADSLNEGFEKSGDETKESSEAETGNETGADTGDSREDQNVEDDMDADKNAKDSLDADVELTEEADEEGTEDIKLQTLNASDEDGKNVYTGEDDKDPDLIAYFTFDDEESGLSGEGAVATPKNGYKIIQDGVIDGAVKLDSGSSQWFDVKDKNGVNILSGLDEVTVSYFSKATLSGTSWPFFAAPNTNEQVYRWEKYFGILDAYNGGAVRAERYYSDEKNRPEAVETPNTAQWKMVTVTANEDGFTLYIDGEKKDSKSSEAPLSQIFGGDEGILQIGKANWGTKGEHSNIILDDYMIFNRALSEEEVAELYEDKKPNEEDEKEVARDLGIRVTGVEAEYESEIAVNPGEDYSLLQNTGAKLTFNDGSKKDDAVITWYDEEGERVLNTKDLEVGSHKLTGKVTYFGSPVADEKADPYVIYNEDDGYYYMTSSWPAYGSVNDGYNRIALRRSKTLSGLAEAEDYAVFRANESGELSAHIWAPEMHKINGEWYIYFAGTCSSNVWDIRPYVLHCTDSSDLLNIENWELKGRFVNKDGNYDDTFDAFTLDMTYFENGAKGYVIWAYKKSASVLKMAEVNMDEPWKLASDAVVISEPEFSWEINGSQLINEGPAVLKRDGKIYVAFSGSTTGPEYCMGIFEADENADLMNPKSWKKRKTAALQTSDLVGQYGPGHNSFTTDADGNVIVVYHARDEKCYQKKCKWAGIDPLYDPCRNAYMAILRYDEDGRPVFTSTEDLELSDIADSKKTFTMTVNVGSVRDILQADAESISIPNKSDVRGNVTLPEVSENGAVITWKSENPEIITDTDNGKIKKGAVTRGDKDQEVTLTATLTLGGESYEKEFKFNVKAKAEEKTYTHYLFAYFTGEGSANGEQIYFADSTDGLKWNALNYSSPVIESELGEKGLRDPFIIRSPEGDKFYLIATDLKINGNGDWGKAQREGSKSIMVWESTDLVNWSDQRMVEVAADDAGCTWAPEAFYDDETGEYMVFWASMINGFHKIWYATTRDFYTFSEPKVWINLKNKDGKDISIIDTSVFAVTGADGKKTYYRVSKDEAGSDAAVEEGDPEGGKFEILETASSLTGEWTRIKSDFLSGITGVEGPTIFKFNGENKYCLLLDDNGHGGYFPNVTTDIASGDFERLSADKYSFPSTMRHGTVINITDEEYAALEKKWASEINELTYDTTLLEAAIAHLSFDDEEKGFSGKGAKAEEHNGYELVDGTDGNGISINRDTQQYLSLTKEDGSALLSGISEMTVNYYSKTKVGSGTQWIMYAAGDDKAPANNNEKYIGIIDPLVNDGKIHVERFNNKGGRPAVNIYDFRDIDNEWKMVTVVFYEAKTALYVNGELVSTIASKAKLKDILGDNGILQIGKANWSGGEYTTAQIDEFTIFNRAVNPSEVKALYEGKVDLKKETTSGDEPSQGDEPAPEENNEPVKPSDNQNGGANQSQNTTVDKSENKETVENDLPVVTGKLKKIKKGKNKGGYQFKADNGEVVKGLVSYNGKTYFFNKKGISKKGFHKVNGKKIYTNAKGKLVTGFKKIDGNKYYFDKDGYMATGKVKLGSKIYNFGKNGKLKNVTVYKLKKVKK